MMVDPDFEELEGYGLARSLKGTLVALVAFLVGSVLLMLVSDGPAHAHVVKRGDCLALVRASDPPSHAAFRARFGRCAAKARRHNQRYRCSKAFNPPPAKAIRCAFPRAYSAAIVVARCESSLRTTARNGQYRGLFQMGRYERSRWGHGWRAITQARAARRYFDATGRTWRPWECKPWAG